MWGLALPAACLLPPGHCSSFVERNEMELQTLPVEQLKEAPYNPRKKLRPGMPEYERLKRSLTEFELVQPLVWNRRTGHVVGGHQRLAILKADGHTEVPAVVVDLSEEREKALNVTLNNERVAGDWDVEKLQDLLSDLIELPEIDETLTGFSDKELNELLMTPEPEFAAEEMEGPDQVVLTCRVEMEEWPDFRERLDEVLAEFAVELEVKLPG